MMASEQNKAIFLRFIDELRRGNLAIIDEVCSPDVVFHSPNWPHWPCGIEGARKLATYGSQLYRDVHATIDDIITEHDRARSGGRLPAFGSVRNVPALRHLARRSPSAQ
jgi:SnoaL-like domain